MKHFRLSVRSAAFIAVFLCAGVAGIAYLTTGRAATYATSGEAEAATLSGRVLKMTQSSASKGSTLKFGAVCYSATASTDNARTGFNFFVSRGFNTKQSAGIIGNLMQESHMDPRALQYNGGPGRGIAQWTVNERWADLLRWKGSRSEWALQTQLDFMIHEMQTTEARTITAMRNTTTINEATYAFERAYERAGTPNYTARYNYANDAYNKYAAGAPPVGCGGNIVTKTVADTLADSAPALGDEANSAAVQERFSGEAELLQRGLLAAQAQAVAAALEQFARQQNTQSGAVTVRNVEHQITEVSPDEISHAYTFDVSLGETRYAAKLTLISDDAVQLHLRNSGDPTGTVYDSGIFSGDAAD